MRAILISWLVEVHQKYKLMGETFFLTIKIIDTYLLSEKISRNRLQLLGIAALWIAAKYQETYQVPKLSNLLYICDNAYSGAEIIGMEGDIIKCVGFDILLEPSTLTYY
jgi:cyclin B